MVVQSTGSETTDNLSEDNPVKNAYRASAHALILTLTNYCAVFILVNPVDSAVLPTITHSAWKSTHLDLSTHPRMHTKSSTHLAPYAYQKAVGRASFE